MKKIIFILLAGFILTAFSNKERTTAAEPVKVLHGYLLRNKAINFNDFNLWVVTNEDGFNKEFMPESEAASKPHFENEIVLAAKVETRSFSYKVTFKRVVVKDNNLDVYMSVRKDGPAQEAAGSVSLAAFLRNPAIKKVNFYHDDILVKSVPMVNVF